MDLNQELVAQITNGGAGAHALAKAHAVQAKLKVVEIVELRPAVQIINGALVQAKVHAVQARQILKLAVMGAHNHVHAHHHVHGVAGVHVPVKASVLLILLTQEVAEQMLEYVLLEPSQEHVRVIIIGVLGRAAQELAVRQKYVMVWIMTAMEARMKEGFAARQYQEYLIR